MELRGIRDQTVIATKVCMLVPYPLQDRGDASSNHSNSTRPTSSEGGRTLDSIPAMSATT